MELAPSSVLPVKKNSIKIISNPIDNIIFDARAAILKFAYK